MRDGEWADDDGSLVPTEEDVGQNHAHRERYEVVESGLERLEADRVTLKDDQIQACVSNIGHELILDFEIGGPKGYAKTYHRPCRPPGDSGITIGIGYDLGYYQLNEFEADWRELLSPEDFERLRSVLRLKGPAAQARLAWVSDITIPWEAAKHVYHKVSVPKFGRRMLSIFPGAEKLHRDCFSVLLSLVFNRGNSLKGESRVEMRNIRQALLDQKPELIPGELRAMKRLWPDVKGLLRRRDAEAKLFEAGLIAAERERRRPAAHPAVAAADGATTGSGVTTASLEAAENVPKPAPAEDGDGAYLPEDAYDDFAPKRFDPLEGVDDFAKVHWVKDDSVSTEYRNTRAADRQRLNDATFTFSADDLRLLIKANAFQPLLQKERRVIFGLRGAVLDPGQSQPADRFAQVRRQSLQLKVTRPDHQSFRCVIGVWDSETDLISGFIASTVPNRAIIYSYKNGGDAGNMLACGCYRYRVGTHRKVHRGCLRQDELSAVLRSRDNLFYNTFDKWDVRGDPMPMDNIHPAFGDKSGSAEFSSFGCQVIRGRNSNGEYTQEFAKFRQALGLGAPGSDDGRLFSYVLLTGLEAAIASDLRANHRDTDALAVRDSLVRIRQGARGDQVRRLETALGLSADGVFSARDKLRLAEEQRKRSGELAGDGVFSPELDAEWGTAVFADPAPSVPPGPMVVASSVPAGSLETARDASAAVLESVFYEIGRRSSMAQGRPEMLTTELLPHYEAVTQESWAATVAAGRRITLRLERSLHELMCGDSADDQPDRQRIRDALGKAADQGKLGMAAAVAGVLTGWLLVPTVVAVPVAEVIVDRVWRAVSSETGTVAAEKLTTMCVWWGRSIYAASPAPDKPAPAPAQVSAPTKPAPVAAATPAAGADAGDEGRKI